MQTPVRVEILGREYTLRVEKKNADRTRRVAKRVDRRMRAFQRRHPEQAKLTTAIITALDLAQDLHIEYERHKERRATLDDDLQTLTGTLVEALDGEHGGSEHGGSEHELVSGKPEHEAPPAEKTSAEKTSAEKTSAPSESA